ncbi:MAG: glycoside hydrolase family 9 protein [Uliginosibacterium sp.]|nr:glycoside hydrolase family 9 protein [Uliginosibacterium sp.]
MVFRYGEYSDHLNKFNGIALRAITAGGGAYADTESTDAYDWAAWELYIATSQVGGVDGEEARRYLSRLGELAAPSQGDAFTITAVPHAESLSWKHTKNLGVMSLLVNGRNTDIVQKTKDAIGLDITPPMNGLKVWAFGTGDTDMQAALKKIAASAFGVPHTQNEPFNWASNADIANIGGILAFASKVGASGTTAAERAQFTAGARRTASYLFGNNPLGKSYVTGYGSNPVRNPHHRFWAKHADIAYPPAPPGMLVGGPNGKWEGSVLSAQAVDGNWRWTWLEDNVVKGDKGADSFMRSIMPTCNAHEARGATVNQAVKKGGIGCYQDHIDLYMTNEVAINWNSALFWLSAYLD